MKKLLLLLTVATAILFVSCKKTTTTDSGSTLYSDENLVMLKFSPYSIEPMKRATDITVIDRIDMWLCEGSNVYDYHQVKSDAGSQFGTMYLALNKTKTYTLYAVGHKANGQATLDNGVISFPDDKVTHSMFYTTSFSPATSQSLDCQMQRIVGMLQFVVTDAIPESVDHFEFQISETGTRYNVAGYSVNKVERLHIPSSMNPGSNGQVAFNVYIMSDNMEDTISVDVTVTAKDSNNQPVEERSFADVPLKNGWVTKYVGTFFITTQMNITFSVGDWSNFDDHPY